MSSTDGNRIASLSKFDVWLLSVIFILLIVLAGELLWHGQEIGKNEIGQVRIAELKKQSDNLFDLISRQTKEIDEKKGQERYNNGYIAGLKRQQRQLVGDLDRYHDDNVALLKACKALLAVNNEIQDSIYSFSARTQDLIIAATKATSLGADDAADTNFLNQQIAGTDLSLRQLGDDTPVVSLLEIKPVASKKNGVSAGDAGEVKFFRVTLRVENKLCGERTCSIYFKDPDNKYVIIPNGIPGGDRDNSPTYPLTLPKTGQRVFYVPILELTKAGRYTGQMLFRENEFSPPVKRLSDYIPFNKRKKGQ